MIQYMKSSYEEMTEKVSWPTYTQLQSSATVVLVASLIFALFIGGIDIVFKNTMQWIYENF